MPPPPLFNFWTLPYGDTIDDSDTNRQEWMWHYDCDIFSDIDIIADGVTTDNSDIVIADYNIITVTSLVSTLMTVTLMVIVTHLWWQRHHWWLCYHKWHDDFFAWDWVKGFYPGKKQLVSLSDSIFTCLVFNLFQVEWQGMPKSPQSEKFIFVISIGITCLAV